MDQNDIALVVWDESVIEKAESIALEGLRPVVVAGMQWIILLVLGNVTLIPKVALKGVRVSG